MSAGINVQYAVESSMTLNGLASDSFAQEEVQSVFKEAISWQCMKHKVAAQDVIINQFEGEDVVVQFVIVTENFEIAEAIGNTIQESVSKELVENLNDEFSHFELTVSSASAIVHVVEIVKQEPEVNVAVQEKEDINTTTHLEVLPPVIVIQSVSGFTPKKLTTKVATTLKSYLHSSETTYKPFEVNNPNRKVENELSNEQQNTSSVSETENQNQKLKEITKNQKSRVNHSLSGKPSSKLTAIEVLQHNRSRILNSLEKQYINNCSTITFEKVQNQKKLDSYEVNSSKNQLRIEILQTQLAKLKVMSQAQNEILMEIQSRNDMLEKNFANSAFSKYFWYCHRNKVLQYTESNSEVFEWIVGTDQLQWSKEKQKGNKNKNINTILSEEVVSKLFRYTFRIKILLSKSGKKVLNSTIVPSSQHYEGGEEKKVDNEKKKQEVEEDDGEEWIGCGINLRTGKDDDLAIWPFSLQCDINILDDKGKQAATHHLNAQKETDPRVRLALSRPMPNNEAAWGCVEIASHQECKEKNALLNDVLNIQIKLFQTKR